MPDIKQADPQVSVPLRSPDGTVSVSAPVSPLTSLSLELSDSNTIVLAFDLN